MDLKLNNGNPFVHSRFSIKALAKVKGISIDEASELWAKDNALENTAYHSQWKAILKHCEKNHLMDQLFE